MSPFIETGIASRVLTLRMRRPEKKNAIDRGMYAALAAGLAMAEASDDIGAVLIAGVPGAFTAGNDIADFVAFALSGGDGEMGEVAAFLYALAGAQKPIIAAVDGLAIGIGTTMLMHCDLVFASPASRFRTPFLDLGLVPEAGSSLIAPKLMGPQRAFALLALGATFSAEEAREANLVYRIALSESVEAEARAAAETLGAKPPQALAIARQLLRGDRGEIRDRIALEMQHFAAQLRSSEALGAKPPQALAIARQLLRGDRGEIRDRIALEMQHFSAQLRSSEARAAFQAFMTR